MTQSRHPVASVRFKVEVFFLIVLCVIAIFIVRGVTAVSDQMNVHHEQKNPDGSWKYTNELAKETSPYLLQHAHNPVDWYPWGEKAFELARTLNKPIFLSVGYSTCYWCHVMERQSFESPEIAAVMNEHFVCVKVDREERPDVDDIYMSAVQQMTRSGGWPMSVWLTPPGANGEDDPGLKPFYAGTYFPPTDAYGRPGFPTVLKALSDAWKDKRKDVLEQADQIADAVQASLSASNPPGDLKLESVSLATHQLLRMYDKEDAGFGSAPKFPQPANLDFLMRVYQNNPNEDLWNAIAHTLDRMARGGMYDQIGGGFHRYSTDGEWLVPHFEKMLYDNGQLAEVYIRAHQIKPPKDDPDYYARIAREICDYALREMTDKTGTFWSAQDAEVNAREGGNYLWLPDQLKEAIADKVLAEKAIQMYGLDKGTNFQDPHHPDEPRQNVLYLPVPLHELAQQWDMTLEQVIELKRKIDVKMLVVRDKRDQPGTDDKVLVSWNGIMIAGMASVGAALDEPKYVEAAAKAADYILNNMRDEQGGLMRTMREGTVKIPAFLEDYAFFAHSLIELYRADNQYRWLEAAAAIVDAALARFASPERGGYYDTLKDQADLFVRTRTIYDGAVPSGNSRMVNNLVDLYELTNNAAYLERAAYDLQAFAADYRRYGAGMVLMHQALLRVLETDQSLANVPEEHKPAKTQLAAPKLPVSIVVEPNVVALAGKPVDLNIKLRIGEEYHINSDKPGSDWLIPTKLTLIGSDDWSLKTKYPEGVDRKFEFGDKPISIYEGEVVVAATLEPKKDNPAGTPMLILQYQACTDEICLEPQEVEVPVKFQVSE